MGQKRKLAVDFDGVIHECRPGDWEGIGVANGQMVYRAAHFLRLLSFDYKIIIHSCRAVHPDGVEAIRKFCARHQVPFDDIVSVKPAAAMYIDDKGYKFDTWPNASRAVQKRLEKGDK